MSGRKWAGLWSLLGLILAICMLLATLAAAGLAILWKINRFSLDLTMNGKREITLEYGETFFDPGAQAVFQGSIFLKEPSDVAVTVEGEVDASTVGTYHITYTATRVVESRLGDLEFHDSARRTVHIIDTVAPQITLTADPDTFTFPGQTYEEEGFAATDNYDGDITDWVERIANEEYITYRVADSSGNATEETRIIVYDDPIPPELKLKGKSTITLELGSKYKEPGYTATDNCDGDITDWVKISGKVNTKKVGTYTLTYSVRDNYDNEVTATRKVKIFEPEPETEPPTEKPTEEPTQKPTEKPTEKETEKPTEPPTEKPTVKPVGGVIYLTFDDGPGPYTSRLLDILAEYDAKASFFVVDTDFISTISRAAAEGHTVAMHTASHDFYEVYASEEAYFADLKQIRSQIKKYTGSAPKMLRFPGGSSNTISRFNEGIMTRLTALVEEKGYTYFDWNVDCDDAGSARTAQEVLQNVIDGCSIRKSSVVLLHDIKPYTIDAIEDILIWGLENGYTFRALTPDSPTCHHGINN